MAYSNDGCKNKPCGCEDTPLTSPAPCNPVGCPEPYPCTEVLDAQCVIYSGEDITCNEDIVVSQDMNLAEAIQAMTAYFCNSSGIISNDIVCGEDVVVAEGSTLVEAIEAIVDYFCENTGSTTIINEGTGIDVTSTTVGDTTTYTVSLAPVAAKVFFNQQVESDIDIVVGAPSPGPDNYFFPTGYNTLTYTNAALTSKTFKVFVSYNTNVPVASTNTADFSNWVDGAIIKTVSAVDTVLWESLGNQDLAGALMDGPNVGDVVNILTTETVVTTPSVNPVEFRFYNTRIPTNVSFYQVVTLAPNETVSLKFKSKSGSVGRLLKAQIMVEEV